MSNGLLMGIAGNIIGGYLMGQQQREKALEERKAEQQKIKILLEAQKIKDAKEERELEAQKIKDAKEKREAAREERTSGLIQSIITAKMRQLGFSPEGTPLAQKQSQSNGLQFGETFGKDSTQAEISASAPQASVDDIFKDPMIAGLLQYETKIPFLSTLNAQLEQRQAALNEARYLRDETQGSWVDMPTGSGGTQKVWQPRFGGPAGGGAVGGYQPPRLDLRQFQQGGTTYEQPVNPYTAQPAGKAVVKEEVKPASTESAGKMSLANQAVTGIQELKKLFINSDGSVNRKAIIAAAAPAGGIGIGRKINSVFLQAVEAPIRAATGGAVTKDEIANYRGMFMPSAIDSDELVKDKLNRFEAIVGDYVKSLDPTGSARERLNAGNKKITKDKALEYLNKAGGDKSKARQMAKADGWEF